MPMLFLSDTNYGWYGCLNDTIHKDRFEKVFINDGIFSNRDRVKTRPSKITLLWNKSKIRLKSIWKQR